MESNAFIRRVYGAICIALLPMTNRLEGSVDGKEYHGAGGISLRITG